jgi:hypothetical protein
MVKVEVVNRRRLSFIQWLPSASLLYAQGLVVLLDAYYSKYFYNFIFYSKKSSTLLAKLGCDVGPPRPMWRVLFIGRARFASPQFQHKIVWKTDNNVLERKNSITVD